jgi:hypothetical protein
LISREFEKTGGCAEIEGLPQPSREEIP